jgi:hypothetical protein
MAMAKQQQDPGAEVAVPEENGQPAGPVSMAPLIPASDLSQSTRIEIGRAVAEVQAAVVVAQARRRDMKLAETEMLRACQQTEMAELAFSRYPRAGSVITGPTVQLMRELMRCFQNCQSGIAELQRVEGGDRFGRSEMIAWAWDLEMNVRQSTSFWVTHARDTKQGRAGLESDRDVYENNANLGARRERAMIERMLPAWFVAKAKNECERTLQGTPEQFAAKRETCIARFKELGVTLPMLEAKTGQPVDAWGAVDVANLGVIYLSITRQEINLAEEFPEAAGKRGKASGGSAAATVAAAKAAQEGKQDGKQQPAQGEQGETLADLMALFTQAGWGGNTPEARQLRLDVASALGRAKVSEPMLAIKSANDLDATQVRRCVKAMRKIAEEELAKAEGDADQATAGMHDRLEKITEAVVQARAEAAQGDPQ